MLDVCLLGTGGMMPLPGRALTSLYAAYDGGALLVDCGEGTQTSIRKAGLSFLAIDAIAITHFHADHISGLPGVIQSIAWAGRRDVLHIYGPEGLSHTAKRLLSVLPELSFPMEFHEFSRGTEARFPCGDLAVTAIPLNHGMLCFGYHVCSRNGSRLLYATDTRPVPELEKYGAGADLLILEGMFAEPEKLPRARESHHMMMEEAACIAARARAGELWLTHFSPANPEPEAVLQTLQERFPNTHIGRDGMRKTLKTIDSDLDL